MRNSGVLQDALPVPRLACYQHTDVDVGGTIWRNMAPLRQNKPHRGLQYVKSGLIKSCASSRIFHQARSNSRNREREERASRASLNRVEYSFE
jgi:hypothetical protein